MNSLHLYNSLSRKKEVFKPLKDKEVSIYVCGITPYDTTHLGHAFTYISFDILIRYFNFLGYKVNYVQNVTDIDDDVLKKAKETGKDWKELGDFWTNRFLSDMKKLNALSPTHYVRATESIPEMVKIIEVLVKKSFAYEKNGNVYFEVKKFKNYGKLSKYSRAQMLPLLKERGGNPDDPFKKDALDFLLWQKSLPDEPFWQSPWGKGRPGWHIECSSMINKFLREQIDIHGGGKDLIFPHHESEIAQSESFSGKSPFVKYWMHTAMVLYEGEKMAKSLGNLVMVKDLLKRYSPNAIRWTILMHHYRKPWEFEQQEIKEAQKNINKILALPYSKKEPNMNILSTFFKFLDDDLSTKEALLEITRLAKNESNSSEVRAALYILGFALS